jgi:hypothetical protein
MVVRPRCAHSQEPDIYDYRVQQPPAYPPQQPASYQVARPTNTLAIISLVAGIAGFVVVPLLGGIAAVITGHMARGQIRQTGEGGNGLAVAGLILGYLNVVFFALLALVIIIGVVFAGIAIFQNGATPTP